MNSENEKRQFSDIICPRCGGLIVLSEDKTHGICNYCDSEFLLSEEELVAAENEAGIERNISGVHLREISRRRLDDYIFQRMSDETSKKYIQYRYREIISCKMFVYVGLIVANLIWIVCAYGFARGDGGESWLVIAGCIVWLIWLSMIAIPRLYHMTADIRNATGYCEYTFAVLECKEEMRFICSDGRKLSYKIKLDDDVDEVYEDYSVVLVHVPSIGKVYAETPGRMRKKFALCELQKG